MRELNLNEFANRWPKNPTQNMFWRAVKNPKTGLESEFSRSQDVWKKKMKDMKTNPFTDNRFAKGLGG